MVNGGTMQVLQAVETAQSVYWWLVRDIQRMFSYPPVSRTRYISVLVAGPTTISVDGRMDGKSCMPLDEEDKVMMRFEAMSDRQ